MTLNLSGPYVPTHEGGSTPRLSPPSDLQLRVRAEREERKARFTEAIGAIREYIAVHSELSSETGTPVRKLISDLEAQVPGLSRTILLDAIHECYKSGDLRRAPMGNIRSLSRASVGN